MTTELRFRPAAVADRLDPHAFIEAQSGPERAAASVAKRAALAVTIQADET